MAEQAAHYSVVFTLADGEHTSLLTYTKRDDKRALHWAMKMHPEGSVTSVKYTTLEEHEKLVAANLAANPARVPLDELTNGQMNRVLSDPSLVDAE